MNIPLLSPRFGGAFNARSVNAYTIFVSLSVSACICAELFCSFVARITYIFNYEATHLNKSTETNKKGRLTDASAAVLSRHRMEVVRRDLPPLFNNQNLFRMRTTKGQISPSAGSTLSCNEPKSVKLVGNSSNVVQSFEQALGFILSNGMFDKYQQFCIQQALQKGGAI